MKPARALLAAVAVVGLTACPDPPDCTFVGGASAPVGPPLARVGEPTEVELWPLQPGTCSPTRISDGVSAEVYSPDNRLLESTARLRGSAGVVRFTPQEPGSYHLLVSFVPSGGLRQVDVLAAVERGAQAPLETLSTPCRHQLARTTRGTWLCDTAVIRGGQVVEQLSSGTTSVPAVLVRVAGDVVWVADRTSVRRYVDTGTTLTLSASRMHGGTGLENMLATENELLGLDAQTLRRITYADGQLTMAAISVWNDVSVPPTSDTDARAVLVRKGDALMVAHRAQGPTAPTTRACGFQRMGDTYVRTSVPCQVLPGYLTGYEDGVLWTQSLDSPSSMMGLSYQVRRFALTAQGELQAQGMLALGSLRPQTASTLADSVVPVYSDETHSGANVMATWDAARQSIVLEQLGNSPLLSPRASATLYWGQPGKGTGVRVRPPAP
ncbi:hypothetical protein P2318_31225 [Myxococcaceae bacterium GXIMD 01537]